MTTTTKSDYQVREFNGGTLFAVVSEYAMYGKYYKSRKVAERKLSEVQKQTGEPTQ